MSNTTESIEIIQIIEKRGRPRFEDSLNKLHTASGSGTKELSIPKKPHTEEEFKAIKKERNKKYYESHKDEYKQRFKEAYSIRREERIELLKQGLLPKKPEVVCQCGSKIYKENLGIHEKSKKHVAFLLKI